MKPSILSHGARRARQRGVAAVELAVLLGLMVVLLFTPCIIALALFQGTVAQRAVHNAAHMIALYPPFQRVAASSDPAGQAVAMVGNALIAAGVVAPGSDLADQIDVTCTVPVSIKCRSNVVPEQIRVGVFLDIFDPNSTFLNDYPVQVTVYSTDRYAR